MMYLTEPNPVGVSYKTVLLEKIQQVIESWKLANPTSSWWSRVQGAWVKAVTYLLNATDFFVRAVEEHLENGVDKKATVLAALSDVYDAIVPGLLPLVLRPFNAKIKAFVIDVVVSLAVDFIVSKYNDGSWAKPVEPPTPPEDVPVTPPVTPILG